MTSRQKEHREIILVKDTDSTHTPGFKIPEWARSVGVLVPDIVDGAVGIEISINGGSNYYPLIDPADNDDVEILATAANPAWVDFSKFLSFIHPGALVRFVTGGTQTADQTFSLLFRG